MFGELKNCCKDICDLYKTDKTYIDGVPRCRTCYKFIEWEGIWCPCCGCRVSHRARSIRSKSLGSKSMIAHRF